MNIKDCKRLYCQDAIPFGPGGARARSLRVGPVRVRFAVSRVSRLNSRMHCLRIVGTFWFLMMKGETALNRPPPKASLDNIFIYWLCLIYSTGNQSDFGMKI